MPNLLKAGQELIARTLKSHGSETVVYRRGSSQVLTGLKASVGQPDMAFQEVGAGRRRSDRREFVITAADLILGGDVTPPLVNDSIDVTEDGVTRRYLVVPDGDLPESQPADAFGIMLRIRAAFQKEVS